MWNYVKMEDGAWYLVDATWDDLDRWGIVSGIYFLVGSSSEGLCIPVGQERTATGTFSLSDNTKNFGIPVLSNAAYVHHIWKQVSCKEPTCTQPGSRELECTLHGETKTEILPARHTFTRYVSNNVQQGCYLPERRYQDGRLRQVSQSEKYGDGYRKQAESICQVQCFCCDTGKETIHFRI